MHDYSLFFDLPKPHAIEVEGLPLHEAAAKLRLAACLRLNGAQNILLHTGEHHELIAELLDDAAVLYDKTFRMLTGIPPVGVSLADEEAASVPAAEGCPGIRTPWSKKFSPVIKDGVRCAEEWLADSPLPLWWALTQGRKRHLAGDSQDAFETGFLLRVQQALKAREHAIQTTLPTESQRTHKT